MVYWHTRNKIERDPRNWGRLRVKIRETNDSRTRTLRLKVKFTYGLNENIARSRIFKYNNRHRSLSVQSFFTTQTFTQKKRYSRAPKRNDRKSSEIKNRLKPARERNKHLHVSRFALAFLFRDICAALCKVLITQATRQREHPNLRKNKTLRERINRGETVDRRNTEKLFNLMLDIRWINSVR